MTNHPRDSVINLDRLTYAGNLANLDDVVKNHGKNYKFVKGDIGNFDLVFYLLKTYQPDVIVNFAAETHNSRSVLHPKVFYETNVLGTQTLLEAARQAGIGRFHHISTCEVYGDLPLDVDESFSETSPFRPRTPYNASKAAADLAVRAYHETYQLPVTVSNCSNNYGPYQFPEKVIPHFTIQGLRGQQLTLYKSSHHQREWLHVDDHCRAIELILEHGEIGEVYNVGSGVEADVEMIADFVLSVLELDESYKTYVEDRPGHDRRYLLDSTKLRTTLGWEPMVPFEHGLRETIRWYVDHPEWWKPLLDKIEIKEESWKNE